MNTTKKLMLPVLDFAEIVKTTERLEERVKTTKKTRKDSKRPKRPERPNRKSCDRMTLKTTNLVANDQKSIVSQCHPRTFLYIIILFLQILTFNPAQRYM